MADDQNIADAPIEAQVDAKPAQDASSATEANSNVETVQTEKAETQDDQKEEVTKDTSGETKENETAATAEKSEGAVTEKADTKSNGASKDSNRTEYKGRDSRNNNRYDNKRNFGGRGNQYRDKRVRSTFEELPETDDHDEIRKQVEFYFSDANLPLDKYLFEMVKGSENKPVPIKLLHSFKRMRRFQPYSAVVKALQNSSVLNVLDGDEIQRKKPLDASYGTEYKPENVTVYNDEAQPRSVYAKGFGKEYDSIQADIESFFEPYGPINSVRLRRVDNSGVFKRSVFVEFESEDLAKQFLELEEKPKFKPRESDQENELLIMSKKDYVEMKAEQIRNGEIQPGNGKQNGPRAYQHERGGRGGRGGRGRGRGGDRRGDRGGNRDRDDWKGRRDDFQKGGDHRRGDRRGRDRDTERKDDQKPAAEGESKADTATAAVAANVETSNESNEKKRAREDDNEGGESPVKKTKNAGGDLVEA